MEHVDYFFDGSSLVLGCFEPNVQCVNECPTKTLGRECQDVPVGGFCNLAGIS